MPTEPTQPNPEPARGARIAHVGIALAEVGPALAFFRDVLGMNEVHLSDSDGAVIRAVDSGQSLVELLQPANAESPIARYLAKRGPGIHHICLAVDDLAGTMERCRAAGVRLIDEVPRMGAEGKRIAFLHPSSTAGILIELTET